MFAPMSLDDRFLDRTGCGDELYLDARYRSVSWLEGSLLGAIAELGSSLDFELDDEDGGAANESPPRGRSGRSAGKTEGAEFRSGTGAHGSPRKRK